MIVKNTCDKSTVVEKKTNQQIIADLKPGGIFTYSYNTFSGVYMKTALKDVTEVIQINGVPDSARNGEGYSSCAFSYGIVTVKPNATLLLEGC
jgi:hypothetical protein